MEHRTEEGETLIVELTPREAVEAVKQLPAQKTELVRGQQRQRERAALSDVRGAVEQLSGINNLSPKDAQSVVDVIVEVLKAAGAGHLLQEIASHLELRGLHNVAHAVRRRIRTAVGHSRQKA